MEWHQQGMVGCGMAEGFKRKEFQCELEHPKAFAESSGWHHAMGTRTGSQPTRRQSPLPLQFEQRDEVR